MVVEKFIHASRLQSRRDEFIISVHVARQQLYVYIYMNMNMKRLLGTFWAQHSQPFCVEAFAH